MAGNDLDYQHLRVFMMHAGDLPGILEKNREIREMMNPSPIRGT
jgi:hypothetical protein